MKKQKEKKNGKMFIILAIVVIVVIGLFTFFIYMFSKYDKTEYEIAVGSVLYDSEKGYIKVKGDAYLTQKFDRNYYLYEKVDGETTKYKLGKNAVVYKEGDMYVYLYGVGYQVLSSGDVDTLSGETKIVKSAPTKFFKLDDRQYLIVDAEIKTSENETLNTKDYVLVNIDKKGNPSFSNHLIDFKTVSKTIVSTSIFEFDIANEKLVYNKNEIDLKNVIGSSNEYEPPKEEKKDYTDEKLEAVQENIKDNANAIVGYYDQYFNDVVSSVNNLTTSVIGVNNNTIASLSKGDVYYDFDYWLALKSILTGVASMDVEYTIFDPSNEFEFIRLKVDGPNEDFEENQDDPDEKIVYISKSDSKVTIRDLKPNTAYIVTLEYKKTGVPEVTVGDSIIATTKKDKYEAKVSKVSFKEVYDAATSQYSTYTELTYEIQLDTNYKFSKAELLFETYNREGIKISAMTPVVIYSSTANNQGVLSGKLTLPANQTLQFKNVLTVHNLEACTALGTATESCEPLNIIFDYKFFNESEAQGATE